MTSDQVFIGVGLTLALAVVSQVAASRLRIPALIILLPAGFIAGWLTDDVNPNKLLGSTFQPLVSLSVAVILYNAGLGLDLKKLTGSTRRVVIRLLALGVPITFVIAALVADPLLGMSRRSAAMLGAILVVSGPTVVEPLLSFVRPNDRLRRILAWEGSLIDPIGGLLGAIVFHVVTTDVSSRPGMQFTFGQFFSSLGIGIAGAVVGVAALWLFLARLHLGEALATSAQLACVVGVAAGCDVIRDDTGLIAAIVMGLAVANHKVFDVAARQPFFEILVQLIIGVLFVSISATVTPQSLKPVVLPTLGLVAILVLVVRPAVAIISSVRTDLSRGDRAFVGWMDPRGIVAAATASAFAPGLASKQIAGATKILPSTFLVIVATVTLYGLTANPVANWLRVKRPYASRPLLVGGTPWALDMGRALRSTGLPVLMWAEEQADRERIRKAGVELAPDELIANVTGAGAELEGVTAVLFMTEEDGFNALAAALLDGGEINQVMRLGAPGDSVGVIAPYAGGNVLFSSDLSSEGFAQRYGHGAQIVVAGEAADGAGRPGQYLLFRVRADGELAPVTRSEEPEPRPGDRTVFLIDTSAHGPDPHSPNTYGPEQAARW
jgi:NhaP-type Na+/H+ or K+/H+ antiporter